MRESEMCMGVLETCSYVYVNSHETFFRKTIEQKSKKEWNDFQNGENVISDERLTKKIDLNQSISFTYFLRSFFSKAMFCFSISHR